MCMFCHCQETKYGTTTHMVTFDNCVIVVKNVPCLECIQCGETFFTDDVMEQLDKIVIQARQALSEVVIADYSKMKVAQASISVYVVRSIQRQMLFLLNDRENTNKQTALPININIDIYININLYINI